MIGLDEIKAVYAVLKEANRLDLAEQLTELRADMVQAREENLRLTEENNSLRKQLELKSKIIFDRGICWIENDEMTPDGDKTPICPQCWQVDGIVNRRPIEQVVKGRAIRCRKCQQVFIIE